MIGKRLWAGAAVLGSVAVAGAPLGVLWWVLAPRARVTVTRDGSTAPYPLSESMFAGEGYYMLIMAAAGIICGYGAYLVQYRLAGRHRIDLRLTCLISVAAGSLLGSVIAWRIGVLLDAGGYERALAAADPGDTIRSGLHLQALSALVVWPFVSVLQYGLFDAVSMWRRDLPHQRAESGAGAGAGDGGPPDPPGGADSAGGDSASS